MKTPTVKDYFRLQALYEIKEKDNEALMLIIEELEARNHILAEELMRLLGNNQKELDNIFLIDE